MQQYTIRYIAFFLLSLLTASCRKNEVKTTGTASFIIINTVKGTSSLVTNFNGTGPLVNYYSAAKKLPYNTATADNVFSAYSGAIQLGLYNYPDTLPKSTPLFNLALNLPAGSIHSLFVTGTVAAPDTVFLEDRLPYHSYLDSTTQLRFINLAAGSAPISINLAGQPAGSQVSILGYKQSSAFIAYPATAAVSSYTFEFRDAVTGDLLTTYTAADINNDSSNPDNRVNKWRFRNHTLALIAEADDTKNILLINNY